MVLRPVARLEAEDGARVFEVPVAPPVVRDGEEDVEPERRWRRDAQLEHADDVALAAPHRVIARRGRPVFGCDTADADTDRGQPVRIGVVARDRLAPHLTGPVEPGRTRRRRVGHLRKFSGLVVAPGDQGTPGRLVLPGTHGRAAGAETTRPTPARRAASKTL